MQAGERAQSIDSRYRHQMSVAKKLQPTGLKLLITPRTCISKKAFQSEVRHRRNSQPFSKAVVPVCEWR